jgi:hypothetical protein
VIASITAPGGDQVDHPPAVIAAIILLLRRGAIGGPEAAESRDDPPPRPLVRSLLGGSSMLTSKRLPGLLGLLTLAFAGPACIGGEGGGSDDPAAEAAAYSSAAANFVQHGARLNRPSDSSSSSSSSASNSAPCAQAHPPAGATLTSHWFGTIIKNPHVYNVGYGPVDQGATLNAYTQWLVGSSYVTNLGEYGVGSGSFAKGFQGTTSSPSTLTDSAIQGFIDNLVSTGALPENNDGNQIYVIFTGPGVKVFNDHNNTTQCVDFCGYHSSFQAYTFSVTRYYAVIPDGCSNCWLPDSLQNREKAVSHELAEMVTDATHNAWYYNDAKGDEIGDLCNDAWYTTTNGYIAQCEWSNKQNGCVNNTPVQSAPPPPPPPPASSKCTSQEVTNATLNGLHYWTCEGTSRYICDDQGTKVTQACSGGCVPAGSGADDQCGVAGATCSSTEQTNATLNGAHFWTCEGSARYICDDKGQKVSQACTAGCSPAGVGADDTCR